MSHVPIRIKQTLFFLTVIAILPLRAIAQTFSITGTTTDSKDGQPLTNVVLILTPAGDTTKPQYGISDLDGLFTIPNVAPGSYNLKTNYIGYVTSNRPVNVVDANVALGNVGLNRGANTLTEVTITAEQVRAQQSGDTTSFSASAFKTNPDASAEDLITKMPGVTSENGTVKVQGEDVKRILVDGKEFFGDDPNAALRNLPAEIIDKIQVFDRGSDQAQFTGFDDGNTQKTINIVTKRGRNNGLFGKVSAGYGIDDEGGNGRYTLGGNINFFNGDRRISIVGLANNINQQNFSSEDLLGVSSSSSSRGGGQSGGSRQGGGASGRSNDGGGGRGGFGGGGDASNFLVTQQGGITETQSAGINYSDQWGTKLKVSGSYFFNRSDNSNVTELTRSYIVSNPDSGLIYRERGLNNSINTNHRANARLEWTIDSMNSVIITPRISFQDHAIARSLDGRTTLGSNTDQSSVTNRYAANNSGINLNNNITYRHRFAKRGRTISLNLGTSYNDKEGDGLLYSENRYLQSGTEINDQHFDLNADGMTLSGSLNYTEPVTEKSQVQVNYSPSYNRNNSNRVTYNRLGSEYTDLDTGLSNRFENQYYYHRGGFGYRFSDEKINFNATLNAQYATLEGDQTFPYPVVVNRNFTDLLPTAMFNYKFSRSENIRVMYRTSTNAPSISQLQNIVDNSNPLLLRTGNPDLRQDYNHNISVRYGNTNTSSGRGFFAFAMGGFVNNFIGNQTIIATSDTIVSVGTSDVQLNRGSQLSLPVNLDGNYFGRTFLTYSIPVKPIKTNFNLNASLNFNRTPAVINGLSNFANNYALNGGIVAGSNISENLDFTLSTSGIYTIVKNTLQAQRDYNYYNQNTSLRLNWIFLKGFVFNTNLTHTFFSGLEETFDQQYLLWNASLGYKFLKNKALQADIYAFDILKQNRAISRNITDTYVEDASTQVLQRYFMLRLTYTLRSFAGAANTDAAQPAGPDGERRLRSRPGGGAGRID